MAKLDILQRDRWTKEDGGYALQIEEGVLVASVGKERFARAYSMELWSTSREKLIALKTYLATDHLSGGGARGIREGQPLRTLEMLLNHSHLITDIPGIPEKYFQGFDNLFAEIRDEVHVRGGER